MWTGKSSNGLSDSALQLPLLSLSIGSLLILITTLKIINERIKVGVLKYLMWCNKRILAMLFMKTTIQTVIAWTIASIIILYVCILFYRSFIFENFTSKASILGVTFVISLLILLGTLHVVYILHLKHAEALKYE